MAVARIVEVSETETGDLYVVAEYRATALDPDPITVEDFILRGVKTPSTEVRENQYGQVRIGGVWVWPQVDDGNGGLVPRPDLHLAEVLQVPPDREDVRDAIRSAVLAFGETVAVPGTVLRLTLSDVPSDSRCPIDVECVWEGNALTVIGISAGMGPTFPLRQIRRRLRRRRVEGREDG